MKHRRSDYIPAVSNYYRHDEARARYAEAGLLHAANESLKAMRRISNELLQKAVHDLVNEQAEALRRDKL